MFWRFGGYTNISQIDSVLDKPDVTVEELLDESDLIQEIKQQNSKLIEFLREEPVLSKLLEYVTADKPLPAEKPGTIEEEDEANDKKEKGKEMEKGEKADRSSGKISFFGRSRSRSKSVNKHDGESDEDKQEAQRKKYAYVACEVLSSEVWSITEALLESQEHLRDFWEYLRRPAPLDPVQAGYFTKVNDNLLDKKTEEMFTFLKSLDGIVPEMLKHVDCPMVMDLLLKMISLEKAEGGQGIVDWLQGQGLIPILLSYLGPENSPATQTSAGDFLKAIITISANATGQDQTVIGPNELTRQLVSKKCITQLIEDMLTGGNPLTVGVGIVIEVIRKNNSDYDLDNQVGPEPRTTDPIYLGTLLREFAKHVPDFMQLIRSSRSNKPGLKAAFGERIEPLGFDRFKTCELMAELLHCSNMGLLNERGSETEMLARDAERENLKVEGKLTPAPQTNPESDEPFASSVDSHGFHHAQAPDDEFNQSPERINRLEVQNATDEDGFEKVAVPEAEALPDEVSFDELNEKAEESTLPPPPLNLTKSPEKDPEKTDLEDIPMDDEELSLDEKPKEKRRVSLLTQQIQDQIDESEGDTPPEEIEVTELEEVQQVEKSNPPHPEDKPAPLFANKSSPTKGVDPILGGESPSDDAEPGTHSTATLQPNSADQAAAQRDQHPYEVDTDGRPVCGDYLKMQFVEHHVVPTILDFFFRFPWNNFLHNVVYDVVQQVFNGTLERGYNRTLAQNLFVPCTCQDLLSKDDVTTRILTGQAASDKSQKEKGMRLGYMGHLTLIAEEVCKFAERHPPELLGEEVMKKVTLPEWAAYVEGTLTETRDRDNAVLGGVRPETNIGIRSLGGGGLLGQSAGFGGNSNALANAGLGAPSDSLALHDSGEYEGGTGTGLLSGFGEGDEDEDEEAGEKRKTVDDDEQPAPPLTAEPTPAQPASETGSIVPPLNIPPSRARRQLAARLAQRRRDAALLEQDPDRADDAAIAASSALSDEPLGNDTPSSAGMAGRLFARSSFDDEDSSSSGLSSDEERDAYRNDSDGALRRGDEFDEEDSEGEEVEIALVRRGSGSRERVEGGRRRRPSTTEAKVRRPIDDDDTSEEEGEEEEEEQEGSSEEDVVEIRTRRAS
ncbi:putative sIT4-associating protein SAP190 [Elsinoe fawcettii]|nr:putative sIT4-associating protein SAP190 [Elsinoe fawcettii]